MNKCQPCELFTPAETRQQRTGIAYHESGHVAALWMFCTAPEYIEMRSTSVSNAYVAMREDYDHVFNPSVPAALRRLAAKKQMFINLAGYAAESRVRDPKGGGWLDEQLLQTPCVEDEQLLQEPIQEMLQNEQTLKSIRKIGDHDILKAMAAAVAVCGENGRAWLMLRRVASWVDEAFSHPGVWAAVVALGERLLAIKRRMCGHRAFKIMDAAWPGAGFLPYVRMGRHWRRRFYVNPAELGLRASDLVISPADLDAGEEAEPGGAEG